MIKILEASRVDRAFFACGARSDVSASVAQTISEVKAFGDEALIRLTKQFDKVDLKSLKVENALLLKAYEELKNENPALIESLLYAKQNIEGFALAQKKAYCDFSLEVANGVKASQRVLPVERAGVYIPAGRYPLVSSVLMNVLPAKVAGVKSLALCTPPTKQGPYPANRNILAAAHLCGVEEVFSVGGAQAVAALAYGTQSIKAVDVITGPGNSYVAEAKKQVYGKVGIDMMAGPTEVLIIADGSTDSAFVAADLLAQSEHDTFARATLLSTSEDFAKKVQAQIEKLLKETPSEVAQKSIEQNGAIVLCKTLEECAEIANKMASEHLELAVTDRALQEKLVAQLYNYGSLFVGSLPCEVLGDYSAGVNHTLPTMGAARYTGGLSVRTFLKVVTGLSAEEGALGIKVLARHAAVIAENEGLTFHKKAADLRS